MLVIAYTALLFLSQPCPVYSQGNAEIGLLLFSRNYTFSSQERQIAAKELEKDFLLMDGLIPTLRAVEEEWISKERAELEKLKGGPSFTPRSSALAESTEMIQLMLKKSLKRLIDLSRQIQRSNVPEEEIRNWTEMSSIMLDDVFQSGYRKFAMSGKVKIPSNLYSILGDGTDSQLEGYEMVGKGIVSNIILPYFDKPRSGNPSR